MCVHAGIVSHFALENPAPCILRTSTDGVFARSRIKY